MIKIPKVVSDWINSVDDEYEDEYKEEEEHRRNEYHEENEVQPLDFN